MIDTSQFDGHTPGLLPCPFCGNKDIEIESTSAGHQVICYKCGIGHVSGNWTMSYCKSTWNTRAAAPDLLAEVKRQAEVIKWLKKFITIEAVALRDCGFSADSDRFIDALAKIEGANE